MRKILRFLTALMLIPSLAFGAASLDFVPANNDRVDYGDATTFDGATSLTMYIRYKADALDVGARLLSKWGSGSTSQGFLMTINGTTNTIFRCAIYDGSGGNLIWDSPSSTLSTGAWNDAICTWTSPQTVTMYHNGSSVSPTKASAVDQTSIQNTVSNIQIGHETSETKDGVDGTYSCGAVWKRVLSSDEAAELRAGVNPMYVKGGPPDFLSMLLDDSTQYDLSGNGNNGTLGAASGGGPDLSTDGPPAFYSGLPL